MIIRVLLVFFITCLSLGGFAQDAETAFHQGANSYVKGNLQEATQTVASALQKYPSDPKLNSLMEKLKKEEQENKDEEKENKEKNEEEDKEKQEEKDKNKDQENQEQQEKEGEEGEEKPEEKGEEKEKGEEEKEGDKEEKESGEEKEEGEEGEKEEMKSKNQRFQEMNLTEEKAKMILEAMKNNEVQYIQQNKRKVRENTNYGKPDW